MPDVSTHFEHTYRSTPDTIREARTAVSRFAREVGALQPTVEKVRLAVSEAVTNAVLHGYGESEGLIRVRASNQADTITVAVADDGRGMHSGVSSPGLGLGLGVIAEVCDGMTVVPRASGGTELRMRFALHPTIVGGAQATTRSPRVAVSRQPARAYSSSAARA